VVRKFVDIGICGKKCDQFTSSCLRSVHWI